VNYIYPSVGNDPEVFVTEKGKIVPSEKLLKERRTRAGIADLRDIHYSDASYKVKVDNAAVEFNFPAATCLQGVLGNISMTLRKLKNNYLKPRIHSVCLKAAMELSTDDMKRYQSLLQFGCAPSLLFSNDDLKISRPIVDPRTTRYRSTGYHVHLGLAKAGSYYDSETNNAAKILHTTAGRVRLVRICDMIVGLPSVLLERDTEAVHIRRNVLGYGRAGEFREQPHGFEYRTLGPWPMAHPAWAWWANSGVRDALQIVLAGADEEILKKIPGNEISDAINSNDFKAALRLWVIIKKSLADLIKDKRTENGKHAILGLNNIRLLEFAIINGGLEGMPFSFNNWIRGYYGAKAGFPSSMKRRSRTQKNLNKFMAFSRKWDLTRDNLTGWL